MNDVWVELEAKRLARETQASYAWWHRELPTIAKHPERDRILAACLAVSVAPSAMAAALASFVDADGLSVSRLASPTETETQ